MKIFKIIGIIILTMAVSLTAVSCKEKETGGTLVIKNNTGETIQFTGICMDIREAGALLNTMDNIDMGSMFRILSYMKTIPNGSAASWNYGDDIDVIWVWVIGELLGGNGNENIEGRGQGYNELSGGETVTITAKVPL